MVAKVSLDLETTTLVEDIDSSSASMIDNNLTDAAADSSSSSANNKDCCCSARLFIEGRDQNITVRRHKQQRKMPRKPCTANPRIRFDPVVNIRYVDKLNQPYAGWITRKIINEKEYVVTKVGFALSNEFVDCKVDLEEQVAEIEARRSISPYFPFKRAYIQTKTTGPLIRVQWDPIATTTLATLPVSCFFCFFSLLNNLFLLSFDRSQIQYIFLSNQCKLANPFSLYSVRFWSRLFVG